MPLRDHFRPPLADRRSWEGFHGGWPMMIVQGLNRTLPLRLTETIAVPLDLEGSYEETCRDLRIA
jgi:hypothetical protein